MTRNKKGEKEVMQKIENELNGYIIFEKEGQEEWFSKRIDKFKFVMCRSTESVAKKNRVRNQTRDTWSQWFTTNWIF